LLDNAKSLVVQRLLKGWQPFESVVSANSTTRPLRIDSHTSTVECNWCRGWMLVVRRGERADESPFRPNVPLSTQGIHSQERLVSLIEAGKVAEAEEHWRTHMAVVRRVLLGQRAHIPSLGTPIVWHSVNSPDNADYSQLGL
jgi:hypothetical protein